MKKYSQINCLLILEFGIPHYRKYIYYYFKKIFAKFIIIHSGEIFNKSSDFSNIKGYNIKLIKGISLVFFNIFLIKKYDLVISTFNLRKPHTWVPFFFYRKKKWIFWGKGIQSNSNLIINYIRRYIINKADGFVVYTETGKNNLINIGILPEKISVAYNTLKIDNAELTKGDEYLLYVGRIQKRKKIDQIIKALKGTHHKLVIVGDGYTINDLKKFVADERMENQITFTGPFYNEEKLKDIFSKAVAYISPSSVGLGVVHSFAYGVPVITCLNNDQGPEFDYCNEQNSYLYNYDSELRDVIENVFIDVNLRKTKAKNAFDFYNQNLSYKNVYKAFEYHFNRILNETNHTIL